MRRLNCCLWVLGLAVVTSIGCTSGKATIDTEPVEGIVTLDGEPVAESNVIFQPVDPGQGMSATGKTDASGVYKLTAVPTGGLTAVPGAGTLPGEYYVGVTKSSFESIPDNEEEAAAVKSDTSSSGITYIVPRKYSNPRESGLKVTVKAGENKLPLELSTKDK